MTTRAPHRVVAHLTDPGYRAGNSDRGDDAAVRHGAPWVDRDLRWSKPDPLTKRRTPINAHWGKLCRDGYADDRALTWDSLTWSAINRLYSRSHDGYRVRTMWRALRRARRLGLNVEIEAKQLTSVDEFKRLAAYAELLWGEHWRQHVNVKCLTTVGGWDQILSNAHAAGFPTIALVRNTWRYRRINRPWITYVRGSAVM